MEVNVELAGSVVPVVESSQIGEARRVAARLGTHLGFHETQVGKIAIVATELATNLVRHAEGGQLYVQPLFDAATQSYVVELIASDTGPGMPNLERCMQDGYSTGGTAGQGLGAVRRLSTEFDAHSTTEHGTVVVARITASTDAPRTKPAVHWGAFATPAPGETVCGDRWRIALKENRLSIVVADGLGHGPLAAEASESACAKFESDHSSSPETLIRSMHQAMVSTRGAAIAVASLDIQRRILRYAGVGNIAGSLVAPGSSRGLFSHNGIVGKQMRKVQEFEYPWPPFGLLVMFSDGLQSRWSLDRYPGLIRKHPSVIAATLARDYKRGRDDLTVLVVSLTEHAAA